MSEHIYKCVKCDDYTMESEHCGEKALMPKPPKYDPEDKYGMYRRQVKKEQQMEEGLI